MALYDTYSTAWHCMQLFALYETIWHYIAQYRGIGWWLSAAQEDLQSIVLSICCWLRDLYEKAASSLAFAMNLPIPMECNIFLFHHARAWLENFPHKRFISPKVNAQCLLKR